MQQTQLSQLEVGDYYKVDPDGSVYVAESHKPHGLRLPVRKGD